MIIVKKKEGDTAVHAKLQMHPKASLVNLSSK